MMIARARRALSMALTVIGALSLALLGGFWRGRAQVRADQRAEAQKKDIDHANDLSRRADRARAEPDGDPVERLRTAGRIRD